MKEPSALERRLLRGGLAAAIPVALGACFYLFIRAREAWFVARALSSPTFGPSLRSVRASTLASAGWIPSLVVDVAPDFLWAFAVGGMLRALDAGHRRFWFATGFVCATGYEIAQGLHLVAGTFDPLDLVAQAVGFVVGWRVFTLEIRTAEARTSTA